MAEFVQKSIEEMLPEVEQMERVGLFTLAETRALLKKRKKFEYKLRRRTKVKEDYLQYIQYEMNVLALVKKRREKYRYTFKRLEIDVAIVQRIHKLFKLAIFRFQDDVDLWLSHIEFCKKRNEKATVSRMFTKMLQVHNRKPGLWVMAAKWEMETQLSMENARRLLQRGLRFNPESQSLWLEYFRMELLNAEKLRKRRAILKGAKMEVDSESVPEAVLNGMVALLVYNKAMESIPNDVKFSLSFLPVLRLFDFTSHIEEHIFACLSSVSPHEELIWEAKAKRHLDAIPSITTHPSLTKKEKVNKILEAETECFTVFEQAVQTLKTEKIWSLYIKTFLKLLDDPVPKKIKTQRVHKVLEVCQRAEEASSLQENLYSEWVNALLNVGLLDEAQGVAERCVRVFPKSVSAWKQHLQLLMQDPTQQKDIILSRISAALAVVKEKRSLPLWQLITEWYTLHVPDLLEDRLEEGLSKCYTVCSFVKEKYILWSALWKSAKDTRHLYKRLVASQPTSREFFKTYIAFEKAQPDIKMKHIRRAYDDALEVFGATDYDLWLEYIQLELRHEAGDPSTAGTIHWRAMKALEGEASELFTAKYTLMQTSPES